MFTRNGKIFHIMPSNCAYGLVKEEFSSRVVELVDKRVSISFGDVTSVVGEGEKKTSIDSKVFHSVSFSGW